MKRDEVIEALDRMERAAHELMRFTPHAMPRPIVGRHGPRQVVDVQMCHEYSDWLCIRFKENLLRGNDEQTGIYTASH